MENKEVFNDTNRPIHLDSPPHKGRREVSFTPERKERFLQALAEGYSATKAARAAGIGRMTAYNHKASDPDFARGWDEALEEGTDIYEDRMKELAFEKNGFLPTMAALKARRPEKWADKGQASGGNSPNISITINVPPVEQLPPALRQLVQGNVHMLTEGEADHE